MQGVVRIGQTHMLRQLLGTLRSAMARQVGWRGQGQQVALPQLARHIAWLQLGGDAHAIAALADAALQHITNAQFAGGAEAGAMTNHLCLDLYDLPQLPHRVAEEVGGAARFNGRNPYADVLAGRDPNTGKVVEGIAEYYSKMVSELGEVLTGTDPDLKEGYRNYTKPQVRKLFEFYTKIVSDAEQYSANAKKARKINRKPRVVSVEKVVKNLKFKKTDQEYKLISIEPAQIMAAQELWTFNTRNRMLTVYRAQDAGGLGVKNVKITGYSESTSTSKRLRKPEEVLQKVLTGGKPTLRTLMDEIKTKPVGFSSRIVADTILLRVIK
mgnify:CR=1 FL=1